MEAYLFTGVILPERAQLSLQTENNFTHFISGVSGSIKVSILNNQVAVWVTSDHEWNLFDLRSLVKTWVQNQISMVGYLLGYAYDLAISRVVNLSKEVDYVFGIDIPCLASKRTNVDLTTSLEALNRKSTGPNGVFLNRCFTDLSFAIRHADDTGFYCYRAVEALLHHCAAVHNIENESKALKWDKFRQVTNCDKAAIYALKDAADPLRHSEITAMTSQPMDNLLTNTWDIVDKYLSSLPAQ